MWWIIEEQDRFGHWREATSVLAPSMEAAAQMWIDCWTRLRFRIVRLK